MPKPMKSGCWVGKQRVVGAMKFATWGVQAPRSPSFSSRFSRCGWSRSLALARTPRRPASDSRWWSATARTRTGRWPTPATTPRTSPRCSGVRGRGRPPRARRAAAAGPRPCGDGEQPLVGRVALRARRGGVVGDAMRGSLRRPRWPRKWQGAENRVRNRPYALCEERPRAVAANRHVIGQRTASRRRPRPPAGGRARPRSWRRSAARPTGAEARALLPVPSADPLPVPSAGPLPVPSAGPLPFPCAGPLPVLRAGPPRAQCAGPR